ncbi:uncharacterized protein LOC126703022 [Quercus robur]|uniref:uncharacterized protein LOC126703022 n=1 Tax=Quercus robur TaxID=38942 RepID=UPI00216216F9|nr:uncharacterized protein LOC126703022 [Quercus robur]
MRKQKQVLFGGSPKEKKLWLTAVELGLPKGRHPLLKDVDVTINPSKGLALVESRSSDKNDEVDKLSDLTQPNALNGYSVDPIKGILEDSNTVASLCLSSRRDSQENLEAEDAGLQEMENGALQQISSVDSELVKEEEVSSVDGERGRGLQTAQVVMNMLDITMPGTLTEGLDCCGSRRDACESLARCCARRCS